MIHWSAAMLSTIPVKATGIGSTLPLPILGVAAAPQALSKSVMTLRTNRTKPVAFFIIHLLNDWISITWSLSLRKSYGLRRKTCDGFDYDYWAPGDQYRPSSLGCT